MNNLINKFLLVGEKFTPEMHLGQPKYNYITCRSFTQTKALIQKFKETGGSKYIYQNELDKACFQNDLAYGGFKDSARRMASEKVLCNKAFNIDKNPKYDGYQ